jgi:hypothetical protein
MILDSYEMEYEDEQTEGESVNNYFFVLKDT